MAFAGMESLRKIDMQNLGGKARRSTARSEISKLICRKARLLGQLSYRALAVILPLFELARRRFEHQLADRIAILAHAVAKAVVINGKYRNSAGMLNDLSLNDTSVAQLGAVKHDIHNDAAVFKLTIYFLL